MPRARSSGALSIWSKATAVLPPASAMTCVHETIQSIDVATRSHVKCNS